MTEQKALRPAIIFDEKKDPEERIYVVLYIANDEKGEEIKSWEEIEGRTNTYKFIKGMIDNINIYESRVLVETVSLADSLNVYEFMKITSKHITDTTFDIEDYNYADRNTDTDSGLLNFNDPNNFV